MHQVGNKAVNKEASTGNTGQLFCHRTVMQNKLQLALYFANLKTHRCTADGTTVMLHCKCLTTFSAHPSDACDHCNCTSGSTMCSAKQHGSATFFARLIPLRRFWTCKHPHQNGRSPTAAKAAQCCAAAVPSKCCARCCSCAGHHTCEAAIAIQAREQSHRSSLSPSHSGACSTVV